MSFKKGGRRCEMKFLDVDVKRPLVAVSAIVDEGNTVVFRAKEGYIENDMTKERIPLVRKNGVYVIELATEKDSKKAAAKMEISGIDGNVDGDLTFKSRLGEEDMAVFRRLA